MTTWLRDISNSRCFVSRSSRRIFVLFTYPSPTISKTISTELLSLNWEFDMSSERKQRWRAANPAASRERETAEKRRQRAAEPELCSEREAASKARRRAADPEACREREAAEKRLQRAAEREHPRCYGAHLADEPCQYCGARLFREELFSVRTGKKLRTPCCNDGDVRVRLPAVGDQLRAIMESSDWPAAARSVNHLCNWVTTFVAPKDGRGFHDPMSPPCLLNLQGRVMQFLPLVDPEQVTFFVGNSFVIVRRATRCVVNRRPDISRNSCRLRR
jgi:hypothetical protein